MARLLGLKQVPVFVEGGDAKVTTEFGKNIPDYPMPGKTGDHNGLDIVRCTDGKSSTTATICAIADGTITAQRKYVKDGEKSPSGGNCVYIRHDGGKMTKYLHLKYGTVPDWVKDNAEVHKGDILGVMGNTGYSFGAHLHFQVEDIDPDAPITPKLSGTPIDPEPYLTGEKVIGKDKEYAVKIGLFAKREDAEVIQAALYALGTDSEIEEYEKKVTVNKK